MNINKWLPLIRDAVDDEDAKAALKFFAETVAADAKLQMLIAQDEVDNAQREIRADALRTHF